MTAPQVRGIRRTRIGIVTSDKMQKTRVVCVERLSRHGRYPRTLRLRTSFKVHDEGNESHLGDLVEIMETRPLSKEKRFRLVKVLQRASTAPPVPGEPSEASARPPEDAPPSTSDAG